MFCVMLLCFGKKLYKTPIFFIFFLSKSYFKNVMEYAFYETTIGEKWECVWNGIISKYFFV
jgi:hypothetical protein